METVTHAHADATVPALSVTDAARRIDARHVLSGASLSVAAGSIVGLLGPNGAGKTSLLRAVAGRLRLDRGDIRVAGLQTAEARRAGRLGVVPQDIALYPHLTVRENLAALGRLAGVPAGELAARVAEGLEWAGLADRAGALVATLSGGMRRRVNLVAGTLHRPALLLLDEPTVGVDVGARGRLYALLEQLRARGMGLLLATHDADEAAALCDGVAVMWSGRVIVHGSVSRVIEDVFEGRREVGLTVVEPLPVAARAILIDRGFLPGARGTWTRLATDTDAALQQLEARILQAGGHVRETRISEPTLAGAVARRLEDARKGHAA